MQIKFNEILDSAHYVSKNSKDVFIDYDNLYNIIQSGVFSNNKHWLEENPFDILSLNTEDLVQLLLVYHSVGFCYWKEPKWEVLIDNIKYDGAFAMLGLLVTRFKKDNSMLSEEEFKKLIKSENEIPLLRYRLENLNLIENNFYYNTKELTTDTELFSYILNKYNYFNDFSTFDGTKIYFYKLAQLLVSDILHVRKFKENIDVDYNNLIGCADYKIPQVLNCYNILKYSSNLENILESKEEIMAGSSFEIEIRANTLVVIDEIYKKLNKTIPRIEINDLIWLLGQNKTKMTKLYHRTFTNFY